MQIESNLVVKLGDAELEFEIPQLNEYVTVIGLEEHPLEEQADILFQKLLDVRNLFYPDGSPVTAETLKAKRCTIPFFARIKTGWFKALADAKKGEAEAKNDATPA